MPIPVNELTEKQLLEVLSYTEGHFRDLKAKEIKPSKLTKTVSAFANADGGELYVGIAENVTLPFPHKWEGFAKAEDANAHLQVFEKLFPLGEDYLYNFLSHPRQTGVVLQVIVRKTKAVVKANDGIPYIRRGAQSLPIDINENRIAPTARHIRGCCVNYAPRGSINDGGNRDRPTPGLSGTEAQVREQLDFTHSTNRSII
jgi:ATP-dependent DNA helicase RecG